VPPFLQSQGNGSTKGGSAKPIGVLLYSDDTLGRVLTQVANQTVFEGPD
jgi:hypothetical protein